MLGLITPLSMAMAAAADQIYQWLWHKNHVKLLRLMQSLTPFALLLSTLIYEMDDRNTLLLIFLLFLVSMQDAFSKNWQIALGSASLVGLLLLVYLRILPIAGLDNYSVFDKPLFTLEAQTSEELQIARFLKENTPSEAVIFTNPSFGELRYAAERALVVSFESFPFQDQAMLDWYERLIFCYGQPQANGFDAIPEMRDAFTALTGDDLIQIQQRYPFTHAVLYSSMETRFPVLYQTETYKIIQVTQ